MKKLFIILIIAILGFAFLPTNSAHAAASPLAVSIFPPIQFPPDDFDVTGLRVGIIGRHRAVYGFDFGLIGNTTDNQFTGLAVSGIFNKTNGTTTAIGLQAAGIANINTKKTSITGLQIALGTNYNMAETTMTGLQVSLANMSPFTTVYGLQVGLYNRAKEVYGFQIGLINSVDNLHGIQIGLLNFNATGTFVVSPFLNAGF